MGESLTGDPIFKAFQNFITTNFSSISLKKSKNGFGKLKRNGDLESTRKYGNCTRQMNRYIFKPIKDMLEGDLINDKNINNFLLNIYPSGFESIFTMGEKTESFFFRTMNDLISKNDVLIKYKSQLLNIPNLYKK